MKNDYAYLVISTRPKNRGERDLHLRPIPPSFNKWVEGWLKDILVENYDDLQLVVCPSSLNLVIPVAYVRAPVLKKFQKTDSFDCMDLLLSSADIEQDEFEVIDCLMLSSAIWGQL